MPRKHNTAAASLLNRDNQRRSRARHRNYVEDLEQRLWQYERLGVQATVEMQRTARAVAAENQALRNLLRSCGLAATDIDAHLHGAVAGLNRVSSHPTSQHPNVTRMATISRGPGHRQSASTAASEPLQSSPEHKRRPSFLVLPFDTSLPPSPAMRDTSPSFNLEEMRAQQPHTPGETRQEEQADLAPEHPEFQRNSPQNFQRTCRNHPTSNLRAAPCTCHGHTDLEHSNGPSQNSLSTYSERNCKLEPAALPTANAPPRYTPWEKSCEEAAAILAQLRGDSDLTDVRRDLGCSEERVCAIRNTELLRIMDNPR